jgi:glycosyltransferase involved in cell wall biosynthesis
MLFGLTGDLAKGNFRMTVVVMIPAHNEKETIAEVMRKIPQTILNNSRRILVIDDGSTDDTAEEATLAGADFVLRHKSRLGLARTFRDGLLAALKMGADIIVMIDADGQYDGEQIPDLVKPIQEGVADVVLGSRFKGWIEHMPTGNRIGNVVATKLTSFLAGVHFSDTQTGFRAYSRDAALRLNILGDYTYTQEAVIQAAHKGLRTVEVPVNFRRRISGGSRLVANLPSYASRAGLTMLRTYRDFRPLRTFLAIGILLFAAGLVVGLRVIVHYVQTGLVTPYLPSAVLTSVLVILGFQAIFLGLIADMLRNNRLLEEEILYMLRSQSTRTEIRKEAG